MLGKSSSAWYKPMSILSPNFNLTIVSPSLVTYSLSLDFKSHLFSCVKSFLTSNGKLSDGFEKNCQSNGG